MGRPLLPPPPPPLPVRSIPFSPVAGVHPAVLVWEAPKAPPVSYRVPPHSSLTPLSAKHFSGVLFSPCCRPCLSSIPLPGHTHIHFLYLCPILVFRSEVSPESSFYVSRQYNNDAFVPYKDFLFNVCSIFTISPGPQSRRRRATRRLPVTSYSARLPLGGMGARRTGFRLTCSD